MPVITAEKETKGTLVAPGGADGYGDGGGDGDADGGGDGGAGDGGGDGGDGAYSGQSGRVRALNEKPLQPVEAYRA